MREIWASRKIQGLHINVHMCELLRRLSQQGHPVYHTQCSVPSCSIPELDRVAGLGGCQSERLGLQLGVEETVGRALVNQHGGLEGEAQGRIGGIRLPQEQKKDYHN